MFLENNMVDERISRAINNDHTAAMKAPSDSKKHMRKKGSNSYNPDSIIVCMLCKKAFKNQLFYRKHLRLHGDKAFVCPLCGKAFGRKHYLQTHLQSHSKHPFQCPVCHKRFSQKGHLNQHSKFHLNGSNSPSKKPFKCNVCGKEFFQQEHLRAHLRHHGDERPFECELCKKRFNIKSSLQRHMSCHTGEKPFLCGICNRGYTRRSVLVLHIQQVHENRKPFQCEECHLCFSQKGNLQAHFRRKHLQPKSSDGGKRIKEGKSKRGLKRQRSTHSKTIKICANKNYVAPGSEELAKTRPRMDNTSLHSYASKVKAIVNRGARSSVLIHEDQKESSKSPSKSSSSSEEDQVNDGSYYSSANLSSLESSSSCSLSDEAAICSSSSDDIPELMPTSLGFPAILETPSDVPYEIKSLSEFDSLLDAREWEENFISETDNMFYSLLPNYDLHDPLSPSKSTKVITDASEDIFSTPSTWNQDFFFMADDMDEGYDISVVSNVNSLIQNNSDKILDTEKKIRINQNSKTVNYSNFSVQKLNFSGSSLQA